MNETVQQEWFTNNDAYLAAAVQWIRLRLMRLALVNTPPAPVTEPEPPPKPDRRSFTDWLSRHSGTTPGQPKLLLPATPEGVEEQTGEAAAKLKQAEDVDPPPAMTMLARRFGLSPFERDVLLLCVAMEFDTGLGSLCAQAQGDGSRRWPTFALALALFEDPAWDVLSPERPLRSWRLIEINQPGSQPLTAGALRADERIVNYVKGLNYPDDRLMPLVTVIPPVIEVLPPSQEAIAERMSAAVQRSAGPKPVLQLLGSDTSSKELALGRLGDLLKVAVLKLSAEVIPALPAEMDNVVRLWNRESLMLPLALYIDAHDAEKEGPAINRLLTRLSGLTVIGSRETFPNVSLEALSFDVTKPLVEEQRGLWRNLLGESREQTAERLASQFSFSVAEIRRLARLGADGQEAAASDRQLWDMCLMASRPRLDTLAQRIEPKATWEDLVLAESERKLLLQIAAQARERLRVYNDWGFGQRMNRGTGLTALFAGESGTGKTMAAEVIANELRLNLYRIDLSAVVSKYIGETEKNLRRVFDAAEDGGAILFFDEADALFGKRSEVKDSHDRYANIEVNYLLQRMEAYRGLAILATNMKSALDNAFVRRLRFIVNFAFPGPVERRRIWEKAFPPQAPVEPLDLERLSRFNLTGASIHGIALNAAFLAASSGTPVSMPLVLESARTEFRKLDKPVNEADFRWAPNKEAAA